MTNDNTRFPETRKILALLGLDEHRIPQDDPFHDDGYDEIALRSDGKIDYDREDGSFTRVRKAWPGEFDPAEVQRLRETYRAESRGQQ